VNIASLHSRPTEHHLKHDGNVKNFSLSSAQAALAATENPKVIQELLRHPNLRVTMDTDVQAVSDEKREAQSKVVRLLLPGIGKRPV
jgi:hypothetical protein